MNLLFDTNVVLDLLLDRRPFSRAAAGLFAAVEDGRCDGFLAATTVTTIDYLVSKALGPQAARKAIGNLLALMSVAAVDRKVLVAALESLVPDFEDAVIAEAAYQSGVDIIVTRDSTGFGHSSATVVGPTEALAILLEQ